MSNDEILVNTAAVMASKNSLDGIHHSLESGLRSLVTEVETLLRDGWIGASAGKFGELFQSARDDLDRLLREGKQIVDTVPTVVDNFVSTDRSRADVLNQTHNSLNL